MLSPDRLRHQARFIVIFLAVACHAAPASADAIWLSGVGGTAQSGVAYVGHIASIGDEGLGRGWAYGVFADWVRYRYDGAPGGIEANAPGLRAGLLRQWTTSVGSASAGLNLTARHTRLSPDDEGNANRGLRVRPGVELQWNAASDQPLAGGFYGSYTVGLRDYFAQAFAGVRAGSGVVVGPVAWAAGGPEYRVHGGGVAVRDIALGDGRLALRIGAERSGTGATRVAVGAEFLVYRGR